MRDVGAPSERRVASVMTAVGCGCRAKCAASNVHHAPRVQIGAALVQPIKRVCSIGRASGATCGVRAQIGGEQSQQDTASLGTDTGDDNCGGQEKGRETIPGRGRVKESFTGAPRGRLRQLKDRRHVHTFPPLKSSRPNKCELLAEQIEGATARIVLSDSSVLLRLPWPAGRAAARR